MQTNKDKFIENSDHPAFFRFMIEELGCQIKKENRLEEKE